MTQPIENHGLIGDCRTTALVSTDGSIDFMCWPRFDSPTLFASLLDEGQGGSFEIFPSLDGARHRQMYLPDSNVLLTRFLSPHGVVEISDFMPRGTPDDAQRLVRRVKAVRHAARIRMKCRPRAEYGRDRYRLERTGDTVLLVPSDGGPSLRFRSTVAVEIADDAVTAEFELQEGEAAAFVLEGVDAPAVADLHDFVVRAFKDTLNYWRNWVAASTYKGRWRDLVNRSALTLKLLTSDAFGSMVAAPTFGLPEDPGGVRNWDYRFTWLRDSAFTVYAFLRLGMVGEANAFVRWVVRRAVEHEEEGRLQVMYGIDGRAELPERTLDHLAGYANSRPVRIGNAAKDQLQLDIYGELMDAVYLSDKYGEQLSFEGWKAISSSIEWLRHNWRQPDEGIWEIRGGRHHFLHSRLMCWVAFDRALRLANKRGLPAPHAEWAAARDEIYRDIHEHFWNEKLQSFVQRIGSDAVDASCLLMPLVRFIPATDPRWLSTLKAVRARLMDDSLLFRYEPGDGFDGLTGPEGTFNMCSFWYVEALARSGDLHQARFLFEKMAGYANHLGLFAEQTGAAGEHLGNFPQAFTHMALISAAFFLDRALGD